MADYPTHLVCTRRLFDGTEVTIRPVKPQDAAAEQDFVRHLSEDSRYYRFMGAMSELPQRKLEQLTAIDYDRHMAFVGTVNQAGREVEIGDARYVVDRNRTSCEFAIAVDDAWQGSGVAGLLMAQLMNTAKARGLKSMEGFVLSGNHKMLKFMRQLGFALHHDPEDPKTVRVVRAL
jgi:GNAT superfamily N-acetyltransferase